MNADHCGAITDSILYRPTCWSYETELRGDPASASARRPDTRQVQATIRPRMWASAAYSESGLRAWKWRSISMSSPNRVRQAASSDRLTWPSSGEPSPGSQSPNARSGSSGSISVSSQVRNRPARKSSRPDRDRSRFPQRSSCRWSEGERAERRGSFPVLPVRANHEPAGDGQGRKAEVEALTVAVRPCGTDPGPEGILAVAFDDEHPMRGDVFRDFRIGIFPCHFRLHRRPHHCNRSGSQRRRERDVS